MKLLLTAIILAGLLLGPMAPAQERPVPVSLIQILAAPEKFNGKLISTTGFLVMEERPSLCLYREDAEHLLPQSVNVVPTPEMMHREEELDGIYVSIVGVVRTSPTAYGWPLVQIHIRTYRTGPWSDPNRPLKPGDWGKKWPVNPKQK